MDQRVTVVGINRTQDASFAVTHGGDSMFSLQKERITRRKHHWGRLGDLPKHYAPTFARELSGPIDLVVECYSSDTEIANLDAYSDELRATLPVTDATRFELLRISTRNCGASVATRRITRPPGRALGCSA